MNKSFTFPSDDLEMFIIQFFLHLCCPPVAQNLPENILWEEVNSDDLNSVCEFELGSVNSSKIIIVH